MTKNSETEWLRKRLDAVILLLMESGASPAQTISSKIEKLLEMGFSQAETGMIVGKGANYVGAIASRKKSGGKTAAKPRATRKVAPRVHASTLSALTTAPSPTDAESDEL